jgi:hypothetical protein
MLRISDLEGEYRQDVVECQLAYIA